MTAPSHRYERQFDTDSGDSLARLARWVPPGSCVLELGPAQGYFTRHLHETLGCIVDAVELDPAMAEAARPWCRTMLVGNLESLSLEALLPAANYDVIVVADVLEHLRDPEALLQTLGGLLKPEGRCIFSVPNVAYGGLIAGLLQGEFEYRPEGLLDTTHLRFFTQHSLARMLVLNGWHPWAWEAISLPYAASEFAVRVETLPRVLVDFLSEHPELHCYQWLVQARRTPPASPPVLPEAWPGERFPIRLFWADETQSFDYSRSFVGWGEIGNARKVLSFILPPGTGVSRLRLRLADRPGFMRLFCVTIRGLSGDMLWQWLPSDGAVRLSADRMGVDLIDAGDHVLALIADTESWLELAWRGECPAEFPQAVEITSSWPESADFSAARAGWEAAIVPLHNELDAVKSLVATRDLELAARDVLLGQQQNELAQQRQLLAEQQAGLLQQATELAEKTAHQETLAASLATLKVTVEQLSAQIITLQNQLAYTQTFRWWVRRPFRWLRRFI